jgi:hypothetical protein
MRVRDINIHNVENAVAAAEEFLERCPSYDGTELSANVLFERHAKTGRPVTPDAFEYTYRELCTEGLLEGFNPVEDMFSPVQDVRDYEPPAVEQVEVPLTEDDSRYDDYEIELADGVDPSDLSVDDLLNGLSGDQLKDMIASAENKNNPRQRTINDEINDLSKDQLRELIHKIEGGR